MTGVGELRSAYGIRLLFDPKVQRAALWVILAIAIMARIALFVGLVGEIQWGYDFSAYWEAARRVLAGESPYAPFQTAGPYSPQQQFLYIYPPAFAAAMTPLAAAFDDYRVANWIWAGIGLTLLFATVVVVARRERVASGRDVVLLVGAALVFAPVVGELVIGNVHLLLLGLLAGAWIALRRGTSNGELAAGVLIGAAAVIKVFPGLIILWLLVTGHFRAATAAVVSVVVIAVASVPATGLQPWLDYPQVLLNLGAPVDVRDVLAPTVWLSAFVPPLVARVLVTVAGVGVMVWAARSRSEPVSFAIAVAVSVLVAPALYQHYLAILVLPLLLAARYAPPFAWVAIAYLLMSGGEQEALGDLVWIVNRALPTVGALLVVAGLIVWGDRTEGSVAQARGRIDQPCRS